MVNSNFFTVQLAKPIAHVKRAYTVLAYDRLYTTKGANTGHSFDIRSYGLSTLQSFYTNTTSAITAGTYTISASIPLASKSNIISFD